jgi:Icc-related predicted phosphoesterase
MTIVHIVLILFVLIFASPFQINTQCSRIRHTIRPHSSLENCDEKTTKLQFSPVLLDVSSIISSSNYPWTLEALLSSAPLMRGSEEIILIFVVEHDSNVLYSQGPFGRGVGLWFTNSTTDIEQILKTPNIQLRYVSWDTSPLSISPALFLSNVESLGPRTQFTFPCEPSKKIKTLLDVQAEIQALRDILNPTKRRSPSKNARKGVSRHKRMQTAKRRSTWNTKSSTSHLLYNFTQEASILRQKLNACDSCRIEYITGGLLQVISTLHSQVSNHLESRNIDGPSLSDNVLIIPRRRSNISTSLRMVVISDTHGFEKQFHKYANNSERKDYLRMPDADILIHCGDFYEGTQSLNTFLAAQAHIPQHFVVRGNHDPQQYTFTKAHFITKSQTIVLEDGTKLEVRPFSRSQNPQPLLPIDCDILITHEPPFGICDRTYRAEHVGSMTLRHAVESSLHPPSLWLCGHIHEGRGAVWHSFGSGGSTCVVNAANANSGKAKRVIAGPVVIELVPKIQNMED